MAQTLAHAPSVVSIPAQDLTVSQLYANFVAAITATVPNPIGCCAEALDVEERAQHIEAVMTAAMKYVAAITRDTASVATAPIDWKYVEGCMDDYRGEAVGEILAAANQMWNDSPRRWA